MRQYLLCLLGSIGLLTGTSHVCAQTYTYDDLGRLKKVTAPSGSVTSYCYDSADNRTVVQNGGVNACAVNNAPTCTTRVISTNMPDSSVNPATFTRTAANLITNCTDPDGDSLTVISPAPYSVTIYANQTGEIDYTVSDGKGGTANGAVVISRY